MNLPGKIILAICVTSGVLTASSQVKKQAAINNSLIFEDLPVASTGRNSILQPGEDPQEKIGKNILVKAVASNNNVYLGEALRINFQLYTALQSKSSVGERPALNGASGEDLKLDDTQSDKVKLSGKEYREFNILRLKIRPFQSGDLIVNPIRIDNTILYSDENGKTHSYTGSVKSHPLTVHVLQLPEKDKPQYFSGAVGKFQIRDSVQNLNTAAGESNNLHIEIEGSGDYEDISLPVIAWPAGLDHFAMREGIAANNNKFPPEGKKIFDIPFVADKQGHFELPAVRFSYFDPQRKDYVQIQTVSIPLTTTPALIKPIGVSPLPRIYRKTTPGIVWTICGFLISLLTVMIFFLRKRNMNKITAEKKIAEEKKQALALSQIKHTNFRREWQKVIDDPDDISYLGSVRVFLTKMLQEKLEIGDVLEEDILRHLKKPDLIGSVTEIYSYCNRFLYAPVAIDSKRSAIAYDINKIMDILGIPAEQAVATDI
jgi:hypothetical protein